MVKPIISDPATLSPLPRTLQQGLTAVSVFGFLSFITSTALFLRLAYRLFTWKWKTHARTNQFVLLIFNLVFADIQQSIAFVLNAQWLRDNSIEAGTPTCWAQGWFVSTGDLASGIFTLAIAVHSFMDIVHDYRLGHRAFIATLVGLWVFNYALAIIGAAMHPSDFFVRAGAWCWINSKYSKERLWLHYIWILIAEFGTVIVYSMIFLILRRRVKSSFYTTSSTELRAKSAAKLIIAYPIGYVLCTLPLVIARLSSMGGRDVTFLELCIGGAMITSNGWLDVLLYTLTRHGLLFGSAMPSEHARTIETFRIRPDDAFGTVTTIEAIGPISRPPHRRHISIGLGSSHDSQENLFNLSVKAETVVQVHSDVMTPQEAELANMRSKISDHDLGSKARPSLDNREAM
jgi:hypothetical protein